MRSRRSQGLVEYLVVAGLMTVVLVGVGKAFSGVVGGAWRATGAALEAGVARPVEAAIVPTGPGGGGPGGPLVTSTRRRLDRSQGGR